MNATEDLFPGIDIPTSAFRALSDSNMDPDVIREMITNGRYVHVADQDDGRRIIVFWSMEDQQPWAAIYDPAVRVVVMLYNLGKRGLRLPAGVWISVEQIEQARLKALKDQKSAIYIAETPRLFIEKMGVVPFGAVTGRAYRAVSYKGEELGAFTLYSHPVTLRVMPKGIQTQIWGSIVPEHRGKGYARMLYRELALVFAPMPFVIAVPSTEPLLPPVIKGSGGRLIPNSFTRAPDGSEWIMFEQAVF